MTPAAGRERVFSELTVDSDGRDALRIMIVLKSDGVDAITGYMALDTLVEISAALLAADDDRFPIIDYATEEELKASGDTEC